MKWVPREKKEQVKELILIEIQKIKHKEKENTDRNNNDTKKKEKDESYYMFQEDSDSSAASDNNSSNSSDLKTLQYLQDTNTSLEALHAFPTIKKIFLQFNTCLPSSAPVERLFSFGGMIMRPHRRKMSDNLFEKLVLLKSYKILNT